MKLIILAFCILNADGVCMAPQSGAYATESDCITDRESVIEMVGADRIQIIVDCKPETTDL